MRELSIQDLELVSGGRGKLSQPASPRDGAITAVGATAVTSGGNITAGTILGGIANIAIVTAGQGTVPAIFAGTAADNLIRRGVDHAYSSPLMVHEIEYDFNGKKLDKSGNNYGH